MLISTIQNLELSGILSVNVETFKWVISNETATGLRVAFDTKENTLKFEEGLYDRDPNKNPIIDCGDTWVLLEMAVLKKIELSAKS